MLRLRRLTTQAFDPVAWVSQFGVNSGRSASAGGVRNLLKEYRKLTTQHQESVLQNVLGPVNSSLKLLKLLASNAPHLDIFQHIVDNTRDKISSELVELFLFRLVESENLNAATALTHIVLASDAETYRLSNQFWSLLASKACELSHHQSASLVYHEIVDPYVAYKRTTLASQENEFIPFLLLPTALAQLAVLFLHSGNPQAVDGICGYFKRFFSYFGHRDVYQTLCLAKVESYSAAGDMKNALAAYVALAHNYRLHSAHVSTGDQVHQLKWASARNYQERRKNIKENVSTVVTPKLDHLQELTAADEDLNLFQPRIEYNRYTHDTTRRYFAIFDGYLRVADLPYFYDLLRENIGELMHQPNSIERLSSFSADYHHSMHRFVVAGLCDLGYVEQAWAIMSKLTERYPKISRRTLYCGADGFISLLRALREKFENLGPRDQISDKIARDHQQVLKSVYGLCRYVFTKTHILLACHEALLGAFLASPFASRMEIEKYLSDYLKSNHTSIALDRKSYDRMLKLGINVRYLTAIKII